MRCGLGMCQENTFLNMYLKIGLAKQLAINL